MCKKRGCDTIKKIEGEEMKIEELSLEEKIGQLFIIGLEEKIDGLEEMIKQYKIGGVILYKRNYHSYVEMVNLVKKIKQTNQSNPVPIFISMDQEGGRVNRMPPEIKNLKSPMKIAREKELEMAKESGAIIGKMLHETGVSMDYAPVLDIKRFEEKHAIGDRCYGETEEEVSEYGIEVMKQIQKQGVISVVKHFPGHGLTKKDSHFQIPKILQKARELEKVDMLPFEKAMKEGVDAIMVGHLMIKDIDRKYPASLSKKIIQTYLIQKYQYQGLIMTDDLKMMAIRLHYNSKKASLKALEAGNDIIMMGLPYKKIKRIIQYITKKVRKGKIDIQTINQKVEKIIKMKEKYQIEDTAEIIGCDIEKINEAIQKINKE